MTERGRIRERERGRKGGREGNQPDVPLNVTGAAKCQAPFTLWHTGLYIDKVSSFSHSAEGGVNAGWSVLSERTRGDSRLRMFLCSSSSAVGLWLRRLVGIKHLRSSCTQHRTLLHVAHAPLYIQLKMLLHTLELNVTFPC